MAQERDALLQQLYATGDSAKKLALSKRMLHLDAQESSKKQAALIEAVDGGLSYAQRKLKKSISGSEETWAQDMGSSEGYSNSVIGLNDAHMTDASVDAALDFVVDPVDWMTGGVLKGAKVLKNIAKIGPKAGKGALTASFSNYVNNYYGLPKNIAAMTPKDAEKALKIAKLYEKQTGTKVPEESYQALLEKFQGVKGTLVDGIKRGAKSFFSPHDAALWKEKGVNKANQDIIKGHLGQLEADMLSGTKHGRWEAKGLSQGHYLNHILRQSGREGTIHPAVQKLADMSNLSDYSKNREGTVRDLMAEHSPSPLSESDLTTINRHVNATTGNPDLIVMKRPEQAASGKHRFDLYSNRNKGFSGIEGTFKDILKTGEPVTMENLGATLNQRAKKGGFNVSPADDGSGYWVFNGTNASAITEGGIGSLIKITPEGEMTAIMSDRHDWLENAMNKIGGKLNKIPGLNLNVENKILENSLAAVSPPIFGNVYTRKSLDVARRKAHTGNPAVVQYEKDLAAYKKEKKAVQEANKTRKAKQRLPVEPTNPLPSMLTNPPVKDAGNVLPNATSSPEVLQALRDVTELRPSAAALGSEYLQRTGMLSGAASVSNRTEDN